MSGRFAQQTSVSVEKSLAEIKTMLGKYGAHGFAFAEQGHEAMVQFIVHDDPVLRIRLTLTLPDPQDKRFWRSPQGRNYRIKDQAYAAWEQGCRAHWRALALLVKAKLEAVAVGISTIEEEFLPHIVISGGETLGQRLLPQLAEHIASGPPPSLLELPAGNQR